MIELEKLLLKFKKEIPVTNFIFDLEKKLGILEGIITYMVQKYCDGDLSVTPDEFIATIKPSSRLTLEQKDQVMIMKIIDTSQKTDGTNKDSETTVSETPIH
jgi:hypothetical protein